MLSPSGTFCRAHVKRFVNQAARWSKGEGPYCFLSLFLPFLPLQVADLLGSTKTKPAPNSTEKEQFKEKEHAGHALTYNRMEGAAGCEPGPACE